MPQPRFLVVKRIATHKKPDADALLATYLAQRYLFSGEAEVFFVARGAEIIADCVVDIGRIYDPAKLLFDHKPPAFPDRNEFCAASSVFGFLLKQGADVEKWREPVALVHEGDARPPRRASNSLLESRRSGFHALIKAKYLEKATDSQVFEAASGYLDNLILKNT